MKKHLEPGGLDIKIFPWLVDVGALKIKKKLKLIDTFFEKQIGK